MILALDFRPESLMAIHVKNYCDKSTRVMSEDCEIRINANSRGGRVGVCVKGLD